MYCSSRLLFLLLLFNLSAHATSTEPWLQDAVRLSGESEKVRHESTVRLQAVSQLESKLVAALHSENRSLALDTISALGLTSLIPTLLENTRADRDAQVHLTLNALIQPDTHAVLVKNLQTELNPDKSHALPAAALIAVIDGMSLLNEKIEPGILLSFLAHPSHEVRRAALLYAIVSTHHFKTDAYLPVMKAATLSTSTMLKEQSAQAISTLPPAARGRIREMDSPPLPPWSASSVSLEVDPQIDLFSQTRKNLRESDPSLKSECRANYEQFYREPKTEIQIFFGYKDARPARFVADRYESAALIEHLTEACTRSYFVCGFKRSESDSELLTKTIKAPGKKSHEIRIRVSESSITPDDELNRTLMEQKIQSKRVRRQFLASLGTADGVFYIGHSRDGGGPDFSPPRLKPSKHVDYEWYRSHQPGLDAILHELKSHPPRQLRLLGLFSCFASHHFSISIHRLGPEVGLITMPEWAYYKDSLQATLTTLNGILGMWCRADLEKILKKSGKTGLSGFFKQL